MKNQKIFELLSSFSAPELRELTDYINSPVHNKHEKVISLFDYYRPLLGKSEFKIEKEALFYHFFPEEDYDWQKIHYLNSYLVKIVEDYISWKNWKEQNRIQQYYLAKAYQDKGMEKSFDRVVTKIQLNLNNNPLRDALFFRENYLVEWESSHFSIKKGKVQNLNLQNLSDSLDLSFIAEKIKMACLLLSHQAVSKTDYETGLLDPLLSTLDAGHYLDQPAIAIYYYAYKSLKNPEDDLFFQKLKDLVKEEIQLFSREEATDIYRLAINNCIRRINLGKKEYIGEVFDLYKSGLKEEVYLNEGQMPLRTYSNIIGSGLRLKEFDWVFKFIYDYKEYLPKKSREPFFSYNLAKYYFELKDYKKAMQLLLQMEYDDLLHNLTAKTMLAQMYYELSEWTTLDNLLSSFKIYIYRKKVLGYHKENYLKFISFTQKLIQVNRYDKEQVAKLKSEILNTKITAEKEWLLLQV